MNNSRLIVVSAFDEMLCVSKSAFFFFPSQIKCCSCKREHVCKQKTERDREIKAVGERECVLEECKYETELRNREAPRERFTNSSLGKLLPSGVIFLFHLVKIDCY